MNESRNHIVRILPTAEKDLDEIIDFLAKESTGAALSLVEVFEDALTQVEKFPLSGQSVDSPEFYGIAYRYIILGSYLLFYEVTDHAVYIHRIIHGARKYWVLL